MILVRYPARNTTVQIPGLSQGSVPLMRLMAHHSPHIRLEVVIGKLHTVVAIRDLDWSHESLSALNTLNHWS